MRNTVAVGIRRRGRSSYVRSTGRHRKGISLLSNTNSSPKAVEASCAVCGHSPKRRGLPSAELTRKCGDLYVLIAQRHPKHCTITASANGLVSLANMRWLHELGRDLQKVAINRDGVWHPKESCLQENASTWHKHPLQEGTAARAVNAKPPTTISGLKSTNGLGPDLSGSSAPAP